VNAKVALIPVVKITGTAMTLLLKGLKLLIEEGTGLFDIVDIVGVAEATLTA
jgi:hypothetical protein